MTWSAGYNYFGCDFVPIVNGGGYKTQITPNTRGNYSVNGTVTIPSGGGQGKINCRLVTTLVGLFALYHGSFIAIPVGNVVTNKLSISL